jgi:hypothetical protein
MDNSDAEALDVNDKDKGQNALAEQVMERCIRIVANVSKFKQDRLNRIQLYRDLYAGKVKRKYRQPFNVVLPVFSGAMDTLAAGFNDDLSVEITEQEPADYLAVRKINALWQMETTSVTPNADFAYKARTDRHNALFSGRGFMMNYAVSDPEYHNCFEVYELEDAIFQPMGGGQLANHLYNGRQNIVRSRSQLETGGYDKAQVAKLLKNAAETDFYPFDDADSRSALSKFKAMGLSVTDADYVGEQLFKLVEMRVTVNGTRYYIVFSPWYRVWVRFDKYKALFSSEDDVWLSWATHEDNKNFLNKSYADDLYGVADSVHTLFNQELTNREKRNFHARGYDRDMFPDVAKLDQAQTRPDALVPVDTKGGARRISDGIYTFETAELQGTINLIEWINGETGRDIGVTDLSMGGVQNVSKKATVVFAEQQNINKRLLLRSSPYTEAIGKVARLFVQGAKDHMPAKVALKRLGDEGQGWDSVIRRVDLDLYGDLDIKITSSSIEMQNSQLKKEARKAVLQEIALDPNQAAQVNPRWIVEEKLRSIAEYDDAQIAVAMDTKNYGSKEEQAYAHRGIQDILAGDKPDLFYGATTLFMTIVHDYAVNNRLTLGMRKYTALIDYAMAHGPIAQENMIRKAGQDAKMASTPVSPETPGQPSAQPAPAAPVTPNIPSASNQVRQVAAQLP